MIRISRNNGTELGITTAGAGPLGSSGFSLIEVLISLVILAVGILAIAQMQVAAIRGIAFSRHMTSATYLARQQLEFLRSLPYDDSDPTLAPLDGSGNPINAASSKSVFLDDNNGTGATGVCGNEVYGSTLEHAQNPLNEQGQPFAGGGARYYLIWRVNRGLNETCTGVDAIGPHQMQIEMQVIWWETDEPAVLNLGTSSWATLESSGAHRVLLNSLRQQNL